LCPATVHASPDRYRPGLAQAETNLGIWLFKLYRAGFADALGNLAEVLTALGELTEARQVRAMAAELAARP
jgi:hypothetical protein